jgi:hypothetical protein
LYYRYEMETKAIPKIYSIVQLFETIKDEEKVIVDVLRQIVIENLPAYCKEKISYNVPYFYGNKGICIIWPASIPRGGIKKGVLLGFWYGNKLPDKNHYLIHGTNKQVYYKIYTSTEQINEDQIVSLLKEAVELDSRKTSINPTRKNITQIIQINPSASLGDKINSQIF